ncbi:MAG: methyl-accepting chemotaxis protein [Synergistaceae bacterium]|nr:methyl-accepting chemotaxis protein [Synergistaceae bacterium]
MKLIWKLSIPQIFIVICLSLISFVVINYSFVHISEQYIQGVAENHLKLISKNVEANALDAVTQASMFINMPVVAKAYEIALSGNINDQYSPQSQEARELLRKELTPMLDGHMEQTGKKLQLHFHLPNAFSLVRLWRDKQTRINGEWVDISDNLSSFRPTIMDVISTGKSVMGIELGSGGLAIRGVIPVKTPDGRQIGSAEVLKDFVSILNDSTEEGRNYVALYVNAELLRYTVELQDPEKYPLKGDFVRVIEVKDNYVDSLITQELLSKGKTGKAFETHGSIALAASPVADFKGDHVGVLVYAINNEEIYKFTSTTETILTLMLACIAFAPSIFLLLALRILVIRPLNTIVRLVKRAGDGDLTIVKDDFNNNSRDEMGGMVVALADMIDTQNRTIIHIVDIARDLTLGAKDLYAISEKTNTAMEEIRTSVVHVKELSESNGAALEESNAGVEEMNTGADTVAQSATDSAAFISQTTEASNKAIRTVRNVIEGMHVVDVNSKGSEGKIRQLVSSVEKVSSFISVITGIADQTNMLALNAAIEAARAGEAGRGFAVVAEEVRKLAEESAQAAENVNKIIRELESGAHESINATTEAGRLLASTLDHAELALGELNSALSQINKANDSIQNIAAVTEEQAASSKEVAQAIDNITKSSVNIAGTVDNISRATYETVQTAEVVAKQAKSITSHAKNLADLLSMFKLKEVHERKMLNNK